MPPSPRLSARISTITYLIVTTKVRDQAISDNTPYTRGTVTESIPLKHCLIV